MGKTYRRDPVARELKTNKYRQRRIADKRKRRLDELERREGQEQIDGKNC